MPGWVGAELMLNSFLSVCRNSNQFLEKGFLMKICVTATAKGMEAPVDPHFGRCMYFVIVDAESMDFESVSNTSSSSSGGAGIQAAQQVIGKGIDVLITGSVGPNAFPVLLSEDIETYEYATGSVSEAIDSYKKGSLKRIESFNSPGKQGKSSQKSN
jgi:predicted Fe-Mo cluster-binding NifX family protein